MVFGSSAVAEGSPHWELAVRLGREAAHRGWCVANGGYAGIMEASHTGAREMGGAAIAVISKDLGAQPNSWASETVVVKDWFARLQALLEMADACFVLYGSLGTLTEMFAAWNLARMDRDYPQVVLVGGQWDGLLGTLGYQGANTGVVEVRPDDRRFVTVCHTAEEAARLLDDAGGRP